MFFPAAAAAAAPRRRARGLLPSQLHSLPPPHTHSATHTHTSPSVPPNSPVMFDVQLLYIPGLDDE